MDKGVVCEDYSIVKGRAETTQQRQAAAAHLQADLRAPPVATLRVVADAVVRAHADPLRDRAVLLHLLREEELGAQRFVRGHFGWWLQAVV